MEIVVKQIGTIQFEEKEIITFDEGLFGFEHLHRYILIEGEENSFFSYLQCIDDVDVTFVIANPKEIINNYILSIACASSTSIGKE